MVENYPSLRRLTPSSERRLGEWMNDNGKMCGTSFNAKKCKKGKQCCNTCGSRANWEKCDCKRKEDDGIEAPDLPEYCPSERRLGEWMNNNGKMCGTSFNEK